MSYNTKQKKLILNTIKSSDKSFTIKEIYNILDKKVGLTTIYRLVESLEREGFLNKNISEDNTTYYQYFEKCDNDNHFYLKCEKCGSMIHIDCECIKDIKKHIFKEHNFSLSDEHTIINGICEKCLIRSK